MPLVLDATALRDLARGLRALARQQREDAERQGGSVNARIFAEAAERAEGRAIRLEALARQGGLFILHRRGG